MRSVCYSVCLILIVIVFVIPIWGQTPAALSISGIVSDLYSAEPLPDVTVVAMAMQNTQRLARGARTDSTGRFVIQGLAPGRYRLAAQKLNYTSPLSTHHNRYQDFLEITESLSNISLKLVRPGVISGIIRGPNGSPQPFAQVQLARERLIGNRIHLVKAAQVTTNDLGEYRAFGLVPGSYIVSAYFRDDTGILGLRQRRTLDGSQQTEDYAAVYYPGTLMPSEAAPVEVKQGSEVTNIDIQLALVPSSEVSGTIQCSEAMAEPITVTLRPSGWATGPIQVFTASCELSDFIFRSIPPGDYLLSAQSAASGKRFMALEVISVGTGESFSAAALNLTEISSIHGTLTSASSSRVPDGVVLRVNAVDSSAGGEFPVSSTGEFFLPPLPLGSYRLSVSRGPNSFYLTSGNNFGEAVNSENWILRKTQDPIRIGFMNNGGTAKGYIEDAEADKKGHTGWVILVGRDHGEFIVKLMQPSQGGEVFFPGLHPGEYRLSHEPFMQSDADVSSRLIREIWQLGLPLIVSEGSVKEVKITKRKRGE